MKKTTSLLATLTLLLGMSLPYVPSAFAGTTVSGSGGGGGGGGGVSRSGSVVSAPTVRVQTPAERLAGTGGETTGTQASEKVASVPTTAFRDVKASTESSWAEEFVVKLAEKGVIKVQSNFRPNDFVNRAEFAKLVVEAFGLEVPASVTSNPFADVPAGEWHAVYFQALKNAGILNQGRPSDSVNRAEAVTILARIAGASVSAPSANPFPDVPSGHWAAGYIHWAKSNNVVGGYQNGNFGAGDNLTRAQSAKIIYLQSK